MYEFGSDLDPHLDLDTDPEAEIEEEQNKVDKIIRSALTYRLPNRDVPKPIKFGENVRTKLHELYVMRNNSTTNDEFRILMKTTDDLMNFAKSEKNNLIAIRFQLEKAKNYHMMNDMEKAVKECSEASHMCDMEDYNSAYDLKLVSLFLMTSCYSNQAAIKLGSASDVLEELEKHIKFTNDPVNKWKLHYNYGTHYLAYLKTVGEPLPVVRQQGYKSFQSAHDAIAEAINRGATFGVAEKIFPLIMKAKLYLAAPESKYCQKNFQLRPNDISEAENIIDKIKMLVPFSDMDIRLKARFLITEAGVYFRKAQQEIRMKKKAVHITQRDIQRQHLLNAHGLICQCMKILDYTLCLCGSSPYQEAKFAQEFLEDAKFYIKKNIQEHTRMESTQTETIDDKELENMTIKLMAVCFEKINAENIFTKLYIQEGIMKDLMKVQEYFNAIMKKSGMKLSDEDKQMTIYLYAIMSRVAMDFPENQAASQRFTITMENIEKTKGYLTTINQKLHMNQMGPELKTSYLLAETSLHYRLSQVHLHLNEVEKAKQELCNALFHLEHVLLDRNDFKPHVQSELEKFFKFMVTEQKDLFK